MINYENIPKAVINLSFIPYNVTFSLRLDCIWYQMADEMMNQDVRQLRKQISDYIRGK